MKENQSLTHISLWDRSSLISVLIGTLFLTGLVFLRYYHHSQGYMANRSQRHDQLHERSLETKIIVHDIKKSIILKRIRSSHK